MKLTLEPDEVGRLRDVAASSGLSVDDFVLRLVRRAAEVDPDRVPLLVDVSTDDLAALRSYTSQLLVDEADAPLEEHVMLHAETILMAGIARVSGRP